MPHPHGPGPRTLLGATLAGAGGIGAAFGAYRLLQKQGAHARRVIPRTTADFPPNGDGVHAPAGGPARRWRRGIPYDLHLVVFGDSTAAGLGCAVPDELPGVLLSRGLAESTGLRVRLSTKAIAGATSKGLSGQVDAMLVAGQVPQVAVILIGANDVTRQHAPAASARRLGRAVERLTDIGTLVVVGTCPDLGVVQDLQQPLRGVLRRWSLSMARAQATAVRRAGGVPVALADTLTPHFHEDPGTMFGTDRFHPSATGYEIVAGLLLTSVLQALPHAGPVAAAHSPVDRDAEPKSAGDDAGAATPVSTKTPGADTETAAEAPTLRRLLASVEGFARQLRGGAASADPADAPEVASVAFADNAADTLREEVSGAPAPPPPSTPAD